MGRASLYFTYRGQAFKDSVGLQIQDAIEFESSIFDEV